MRVSCDTVQRRGRKKGGDERESWEKDRETERVRGWAALGGLMTLLVACSGPREQGTAGQWLPAAVPRKSGPQKVLVAVVCRRGRR